MPEMTIEAPPAKKFLGNAIKFEIDRNAASARDESRAGNLRLAICNAVPVTPVMLGRWLNNTSQPDLRQAYCIAQVLGVTVNDLCHLEAEPEA